MTISDGDLGCTGSVAEGSCQFLMIATGERTLQARYAGDGEFCQSSTSAPHFVAAGSQTVFVDISPSPTTVGEPTVATARVNSLVSWEGPATGPVTIDDGAGASCFGNLVDGEMSCLITPLVGGRRAWNAVYGGDETFVGSSGFTFHTVNRAATATEMTSVTPNPATVPQLVSVDVSVSVVGPGGGTPAGSVVIEDITGASCIAPLVAGLGTCDLAPTVFGSRQITARYLGSESFEPSVTNELLTVLGTDFGDAPAPFPTALGADGARHNLGAGVFLGSSVDSELDGQPSATALGDDANSDDEDGVAFSGPAIPGGTIAVTVQASGPGLLDAWIDFNGDGSWNEVEERVFTAQPVNAGSNVLPMALPSDAISASVVGRFRLSSTGVAGPTGPAVDGEVEDHVLHVEAPALELDYSASPDTLPETGAAVTFTVMMSNTGTVEVPVTNLESSGVGDLDNRGNCSLPQTLAGGESYECSFTHTVSGTAGDDSDTLLLIAPVAGTMLSLEAEASYTFTDVEPMISMTLTPDRETVPEPQATVTFELEVQNDLNEELMLETLSDATLGDLSDIGSCALPQSMAPLGSYSCSYEVLVEGAEGDVVDRSVSASAVDDEANTATSSAQTTLTVVDGIAPQVLDFKSLDGASVDDCDTVQAPIEGFQVIFDEAVVAEDLATSYLIVAAGADADFSTAECAGGVAGDDLALTIAQVSSDGDAQTPTATIELQEAAPEGLLRFLVCPAVQDGAGNSAGPETRTFRSDPRNLFSNGDFDRCPATLEPWAVVALAPNLMEAEDFTDAQDSAQSGSAMIFSADIGATSLGQCVDLAPTLELEMRLASRFEPILASTATLTATCQFFEQSQCAGNAVSEPSSSSFLADSGGAWMESGFFFEPPQSALSALCAISVMADDPADPSFNAYLDRLFLGSTGLIFRDDFESGDTSFWSLP